MSEETSTPEERADLRHRNLTELELQYYNEKDAHPERFPLGKYTLYFDAQCRGIFESTEEVQAHLDELTKQKSCEWCKTHSALVVQISDSVHLLFDRNNQPVIFQIGHTIYVKGIFYPQYNRGDRPEIVGWFKSSFGIKILERRGHEIEVSENTTSSYRYSATTIGKLRQEFCQQCTYKIVHLSKVPETVDELKDLEELGPYRSDI